MKEAEESFKPMLAADVKGDLDKVKFPVQVSAKIDGIRAIVKDGRLLSRSLKPIPNKAIRAALERSEFEGFDGELIAGEGTNFQQTTSKVMSPNEDTAGVEYWVFDLHDFDGPSFARQAELTQRMAKISQDDEGKYPVIVELVPQTLAKSPESVLELEAAFLSQGFEGAMLRSPTGLYKYGRSTVKEGGLMKLKRFEDAEATIVGFEEEMANNNEATTDELGHTKRSSAKDGKIGKGTLGAFNAILSLPTDREVRFNLGCGFTAEQRRDFWERRGQLAGRTVKFKHLPCGAKDAPRHPVFLGFRADEDMSQ